ncbi:hypothetical protein C1Y40_02709 [Mycobacterium talmoniae]|uniref:Uncharacterized protein n=1 Tax=Mycobacterium talmoniae TaxID=1858794 RepID=A0A2S8BKF6_9MYCO|nr:hypothetical protein C1Y40_02709 [Mycobacterium talmoniae]
MTHSAGQFGKVTVVTAVPGSGGTTRSGLSITSSRARCSRSGRIRLITRPIRVRAPSTGRTKMAVNVPSIRDCQQAGP